MLAEQTAESWIPASDTDKAAVQKQLEKLLATPLFNSSKRYPSLLKFVVTNALSGQTEQLKERILGVEIFGRAPDYDTTSDPIVRVTAAEIRKRIEQYYHEPNHENEIRLILPSGSYVPQFFQPGQHAVALAHQSEAKRSAEELAEDRAHSLPPASLAHAAAPPVKKILVALLSTAIVVGMVLAWRAAHPPVVQQFWEPIIKSGEPVLFCIADQSQYSTIKLRDAADPNHQITLNDTLVTVIIDDVSPLVNVAGMLRTYGKTYRVQGDSGTTLTDLRRGPSVFIGAFDNGWTLRLTAPLRFHFANNSEMTRLWVADRENPTNQDWFLDRTNQQQTGTYKDYAIVARFVDPNTDQPAVVVAGIARGGTIAAGEFLVDADRMSEILHQAPRNWNHKNIEIVLETQVIQGHSGPPRVNVVYTW
jgi:hypothetical protein